jgi:hypothetical protein
MSKDYSLTIKEQFENFNRNWIFNTLSYNPNSNDRIVKIVIKDKKLDVINNSEFIKKSELYLERIKNIVDFLQKVIEKFNNLNCTMIISITDWPFHLEGSFAYSNNKESKTLLIPNEYFISKLTFPFHKDKKTENKIIFRGASTGLKEVESNKRLKYAYFSLKNQNIFDIKINNFWFKHHEDLLIASKYIIF